MGDKGVQRMNEEEKQEILNKAKDWFRETIIQNHLANTKKLFNPNEFNINPFLTPYLAAFLSGEVSPESVAKALVYPRVLGSSITTSFGQNVQNFISTVLESYGSLTAGIDIEFIDAFDGRKKYCQVKLGPNTINKDDITTIHNHFRAARNLGRTNNNSVQINDLVVGILYGEPGQESNHYQKLRDEHNYVLLIGKEFWHHLTGDEGFYDDFIKSISELAIEAQGKIEIENVINILKNTDEIKKLSS